MTEDTSNTLIILLVLVALVLSVIFTWKVMDHETNNINNKAITGNAIASQPSTAQGQVSITILPSQSIQGAHV